MPTHVQAPDGSVIEFPDGMSDDQITAVMRQHYPPSADDATRTQAAQEYRNESPLVSGARSLLNGMTFGYGPQLTAWVGGIERGDDPRVWRKRSA